MRHVIFSPKVHDRINIYSQNYREYWRCQYEDSGVWSENIIIQSYIDISDSRKKEIYQTIVNRISQDLPIGHSGHNTVKIPWRTKMLHVTYEDISEEERIITDLEILTT